jgi:hypothetical protein
MILTGAGKSAKYFKGMAIPSSKRNEMPSKKAMPRRRPMGVRIQLATPKE